MKITKSGSWALALLAVLGLLLEACTADTESSVPNGSDGQILVTPDIVSPTLTVNVTLTDEGFQPSTIFLPAGRHIELVIRNRGTDEHHYRIAGLVPAGLNWIVSSEIDEDEILAMSPAELEALGIDSADMSNLEHVAHHLGPTAIAFKPESAAGIKPLPNEVHAYASIGGADIVIFYPLNIGTFVAEDVLHPEITGKVVVFGDGS